MTAYSHWQGLNFFTIVIFVKGPFYFMIWSIVNVFNPFPNKTWILRVCSTSLLKTLREKEKLLVTSNFSFSYSVFYQFEELISIFIKSEIFVCKLFQFGRVQNLLFGNGLKDVMIRSV